MNRRTLLGSCLGFLGTLFGVRSACSNGKAEEQTCSHSDSPFPYPSINVRPGEVLQEPGCYIVWKEKGGGGSIHKIRGRAVIAQYEGDISFEINGVDFTASGVDLITYIGNSQGQPFLITYDPHIKKMTQIIRLEGVKINGNQVNQA